MYSGGTWRSSATASSCSRCSLHSAAPAAMRSSRRKRARYSHHCSVFLGRAAHGLDDLRLRLGFRQQSQRAFARDALPGELGDEGADVGTRQVEVAAPGVGVAGAGGEAGEGQDEQGGGAEDSRSAHVPTSLRREYRPMRIPKPASSVTTEVPP
ncbi:MAG: hypothetical protein U1F06_07475 [Steroidobacteraceae bacterium]